MDSVFQRLYETYQQDVYQFLIYLVKDPNVSEDLMQEVFIRVMKAYERFEGKSSEKTWLFSIAKNVAIDHFRKQSTLRKRIFDRFDWSREDLPAAMPLPEEIAQQREEIQALYACLDFCSTDQKMVVIMRFMQDLSIAETAEALGWTQGKVKTTQHRAIKLLKERMSETMRKEEDQDEALKMGRS